MPSYLAKIKKGQAVDRVTIVAAGLNAAKKDAQRQGKLIEIKRINSQIFGLSMSVSDRSVFFQRLASMVASKVGMSEALKIISESFTGSVKSAADIIRRQIEAGASLSEAMAIAGPRYFPETIVAIIRTGSQGGDMANALREAVRFEQELQQVKKESGKGLWSAGMGFMFGIATLLASTLYIAPEMMESDLIKQNRDAINVDWVMTLATVMNWIVGFILVVTVVVVFMLFFLRPLIPVHIDRVILQIPYYKDLVLARTNYLSFFGLSVLLKAGLRVEEALRLARDTTPRGEMKADLERARKAVVDGSSRPWPYVMRTLHPTDRASLATAEDRAQIAATVGELSIQYRNLFRQRVETLVPLAQTFSATFLMLAGTVLFGVVILPMMQVTNAILAGAM